MTSREFSIDIYEVLHPLREGVHRPVDAAMWLESKMNAHLNYYIRCGTKHRVAIQSNLTWFVNEKLQEYDYTNIC